MADITVPVPDEGAQIVVTHVHFDDGKFREYLDFVNALIDRGFQVRGGIVGDVWETAEVSGDDFKMTIYSPQIPQADPDPQLHERLAEAAKAQDNG